LIGIENRYIAKRLTNVKKSEYDLNSLDKSYSAHKKALKLRCKFPIADKERGSSRKQKSRFGTHRIQASLDPFDSRAQLL
jgi:hypothetical protein